MGLHNITGEFKSIYKRLFKSKDEYGENRKSIVVDNYFAGITDTLINGNLFTGMLILLHAEDIFIGIVTMIRSLGNILQILSPLFLEKYERRKRVLISGRACTYMLNIIFIGIIPFLSINNSTKLYLIFGVTMFSSFIGAILGPGYTVWHIKSVPMKVRDDYFSFMSVTSNVIIFLTAFLAGKFVDIYKADGNELTGITIIRIIALIICILDIIALTKIREYPNSDKTINKKTNLKDALITPFKEKKYLLTVAVGCLWNLSASIPGPYFTVYLLKDLGVSYSTISLVNMILPIMLIFMTTFWNRKIKKTSYFKTLKFLMSIYLIHYLGLSLVSHKTIILYPLFVLLAFVFYAGIARVFAGIIFVNMPESNQTNFIGFYQSMNSVAAFIGMEIGNIFIKFTKDIKLSVFGLEIYNKQLLLVFTAIVMLCAVILISYLDNLNNRRTWR